MSEVVTPTAVETSEKEQGKSTKDLFNYADWLHVGPDADECEDRKSGKCGDPLHFHAWCRLPNQFEHQACKDKGLAAKARRVRQMRDSDSDAHTILEGDLYELERLGDDAREGIVAEIMAKDWWRYHMQAMATVTNEEDGDGNIPFEHIADDQERYQAILAMPEEERPSDEQLELAKHLAAFGDAVTAERERVEGPQRTALMGKPLGELVTMLRDDRIAAEGQAMFMQTYAKWEWFYGTFKPVEGRTPNERVFENIEQLEAAEPHVIEALSGLFDELEKAVQQGNS